MLRRLVAGVRPATSSHGDQEVLWGAPATLNPHGEYAIRSAPGPNIRAWMAAHITTGFSTVGWISARMPKCMPSSCLLKISASWMHSVGGRRVRLNKVDVGSRSVELPVNVFAPSKVSNSFPRL